MCNRRCGCGRQDGGFKRREGVDDSTRRRRRDGTNRHWYSAYLCTSNCNIPVTAMMFSCAPRYSHLTGKSMPRPQLGRHFIVNLLWLFAFALLYHDFRYSDLNQQDIFCRLLTLTADRGAAFHFILFDVCKGPWPLFTANGECV